MGIKLTEMLRLEKICTFFRHFFPNRAKKFLSKESVFFLSWYKAASFLNCRQPLFIFFPVVLKSFSARKSEPEIRFAKNRTGSDFGNCQFG